MPDFSLEDRFHGTVCGIDEVGRGPLAGPVVAACVHIPAPVRSMDFITEIQDSKKLSPKKREKLYAEITAHCPYAISEISVQKIDQINILNATLHAMSESYTQLKLDASMALVDGNKAPQLPCPVTTVIKGDQTSVSIAAASIVAKVYRDRLMQALDKEFPGYGWGTNAGYGSKKHIEAIHNLGITPHHRRSFEPVKSLQDSATTY